MTGECLLGSRSSKEATQAGSEEKRSVVGSEVRKVARASQALVWTWGFIQSKSGGPFERF